MELVVVNGDKDGKLDGQHGLATVTGATGPVTFTCSRRPPVFTPDATEVDNTPLGAGQYELTFADRWLWYVTADDGATTAVAAVWVWTSNYVVDLEIAAAAQLILEANKLAIEARARQIEPDWELKLVMLGMREEVDVVPAIEVSASGADSAWRWAPLGRAYEFSLQVCVYAHWSDDVVSDQELLVQVVGAVRDVMTMYETYHLESGLHIVDFVPTPVQYMETLAMDGKIIGMGVLTWNAKAEWSAPVAY